MLLSNNIATDTCTNMDEFPKPYAEQKTPNMKELMLYMIPFILNGIRCNFMEIESMLVMVEDRHWGQSTINPVAIP